MGAKGDFAAAKQGHDIDFEKQMKMGQKQKRMTGEELDALLDQLSNYQISASGRPLSQDLVSLIVQLWAQAHKVGVKDAQEWVCKWVGISRQKMQELITEVYSKGAMAKKKRKQRKWMKEPKIPRDVQTEAAEMMHLWNKKGTLATIPKLQQWMREEKGIEVTERRIRHYITKMGFKWGKTKQKGLLAECKRMVEWKHQYLEKGVC